MSIKRKAYEEVDVKDYLGFTEKPVQGLVTLRFWDKNYTVPKSDLLESPYFRRFLGEEGAFKPKPLEDGSYFINESGKDFEEVLYNLRGETLDRDTRLQQKMLRYLPDDVLEVESENQAQKAISDRFTSFFQKWLNVDGVKNGMSCFRRERNSRGYLSRRFFYHFNVVEVVQAIPDGAKIVVERHGDSIMNVHLWVQSSILEVLLTQSNFDFMATLPESAGWGSTKSSLRLIECKGFLTDQAFILMAKEVDALDIKVDDALEAPAVNPIVVNPPPPSGFGGGRNSGGPVARAAADVPRRG